MKKVFISYSHQDSQWKDRLVKHLKVIESKDYCDLWYDGKIQPGDDWYKEIYNALKEAQIIIMMISTAFLASHFIKTEEVPRILEKLQKGGIRVIPVIVSHCAWKTVPWLASIQVILFKGKPLSILKGDE
ncbi:MAG TPA: toll/interleukin-1 receptor domain-containing protein, partial [Candidatus Kapabacteria bacterium]|nr:toll/interleukin-1 receptor domain-containing protein [Candidatus Kapabacteria bacterium]